MSLGFDPFTELVLPPDTRVEERDVVTEEDVYIGGQSTVEFGIRAKNVVAGERVQFDGHIEATGDCRLDMWCQVGGDVLVGEDAYLGERVAIDGQLLVSGDLDIGDDVQIEDGFEANGWIVIRNPMPTIVFLYIYLTQLLRLGEEAAAEEVFAELLETDESDEQPLCIPRSATVSDDSWQVSTPGRTGSNCRLHGNIRATELVIGSENNIFGSLRARGDIEINEHSRIHGDVTTRAGDVTLHEGVEILGDVSCEDLSLGADAVVDGAIRANGAVTMGATEREPEK